MSTTTEDEMNTSVFCIVIVTGGGGFLGQRLVAQLINDGTLGYDTEDSDDANDEFNGATTCDSTDNTTNNIEKTKKKEKNVIHVPIKAIVLADVYFSPNILNATNDVSRTINIIPMMGDISDKAYCQSLYSKVSDIYSTSKMNDSNNISNKQYVSIYHLGAIMSGDGELDFDLCMNVNLYGCINLLDCTRQYKQQHQQNQHQWLQQTLQGKQQQQKSDVVVVKLIFASAGAIIGCGAPTDYISVHDTVNDTIRSTPHTTYGTTKACCELLCNDYHRKQYVNCIVGIRLPTVIVRAGAPNSATTSCFSSIVREPLNGVDVTIPIDGTILHAVTSTRLAIRSMIHVHNVHTTFLNNILGYDRTIFIPAVPVTLQQLQNGLYRYIATRCNQSTSIDRGAETHRDCDDDPKFHLGKITYTIDRTISNIVRSFPIRVDAFRAIQLGIEPSKPVIDFIDTLIDEYVDDFPNAITPQLYKQLKQSNAEKDKEYELQQQQTLQSSALYNNYKVAVITGGGSGIGRAVAIRLIQEKDNNYSTTTNKWVVVVAGRRFDLLEETRTLALKHSTEQSMTTKTQADDTNINTDYLFTCIQTDVTKEEDVVNLFQLVYQKHKRIDVLFNNAGISTSTGTPIVDVSVHDFESVLRTNVIGPFVCSREAIRIFVQTTAASNNDTIGSTSGDERTTIPPRFLRIINNGSLSAHVPRPYSVAYTISKHAISGLTKSIALDGRSYNVSCGQIDFGNVTTTISTTTNNSTLGGAIQANGTTRLIEPYMSLHDAATAVVMMCNLPPESNVLTMTIMATTMPYVGRG